MCIRDTLTDMKRVNITVDEEMSKVLESKINRSQFIRDAVMMYHGDTLTDTQSQLQRLSMLVEGLINDVVELKEELKKPKEDLGSLELPCCLTACRHWQWNDSEAIYVNTLSGRSREE